MRFIGIDPGVSGGIAVIDNGEARAWATPETEMDTLNILLPLFKEDDEVKCLLEQVSAMPGNGSTGMFTFGKNYGFFRGVLAGRVSFADIQPKVWQKGVGANKTPPKTVSSMTTAERNKWYGEKKNHHKQIAQNLFPKLKVTHAVADALLIAEFLRRFELGLIPRRENQELSAS